MREGIKIYLAGKINKNDWRHDLVKGLRGAIDLPSREDAPDSTYETASFPPWPTLSRSLFDLHDYVGPYFISCDHGCFHRPSGHAYVFGEFVPGIPEYRGNHECMGCRCSAEEKRHNCVCRGVSAKTVEGFCREAILRADVVFAWIDDVTAYGTILEIGMARAFGKPIWLATPEYYPDLWLTYETADRSNDRCNVRCASHVIPYAKSAEWALGGFLEDHALDALSMNCESPMEVAFWNVARRFLPDLLPQVSIPPYRLDFAIPEKRLAIEIDGHEFHKTKDQRTADAARDRALQQQGWRIMRFTGTEVHRDAYACVNEVRDLLGTEEG